MLGGTLTRGRGARLIQRNNTVDQYDETLERLVKLRAKSAPLPATVSISGNAMETRRFLERYRFDRRVASPAMAAHIPTIERPLVCEAALSLL